MKVTDLKKTYRSEEMTKKLTKRINIVEGQVKGIKQMVIDDRYCGDILIQVAAINRALKSLSNEILKNHLTTCVVEDSKLSKTKQKFATFAEQEGK